MIGSVWRGSSWNCTAVRLTSVRKLWAWEKYYSSCLPRTLPTQNDSCLNPYRINKLVMRGRGIATWYNIKLTTRCLHKVQLSRTLLAVRSYIVNQCPQVVFNIRTTTILWVHRTSGLNVGYVGSPAWRLRFSWSRPFNFLRVNLVLRASANQQAWLVCCTARLQHNNDTWQLHGEQGQTSHLIKLELPLA